MGFELLVKVFINKPRDDVSVVLVWQSECVRTGTQFVSDCWAFMTVKIQTET